MDVLPGAKTPEVSEDEVELGFTTPVWKAEERTNDGKDDTVGSTTERMTGTDRRSTGFE